ncbi:MAG: hypothetical protein Q8R79_04155 [Legionellaceae bacterium]|nr:hypothetical protein [Legionellaceae bacterium]
MKELCEEKNIDESEVTIKATELYAQQLDVRLGASERAEEVYMTDGERGCNNAENSSAKSIDARRRLEQFLEAEFLKDELKDPWE